MRGSKGALSAPSSSSSIALAIASAAVVGCTIYSYHYAKNDNANPNANTNTNTKNRSSEEDAASDDRSMSMIAVPGSIQLSDAKSLSSLKRLQTPNTITIAYASTTGTCQAFAKSLHNALSQIMSMSAAGTDVVQLCTVDELDWWDEILNNEHEHENSSSTPPAASSSSSSSTSPPIVIFILPTWTNGTLPEKYGTLLSSLDEICHDWRVAPKPLRAKEQPPSDDTNSKSSKSSGPRRKTKKLKHTNDKSTIQIASFGMGSSAYDTSTFCKPARDVFKYFMKLGARSLLTSHGRSVVGTADDEMGDCQSDFQQWMEGVVQRVGDLYQVVDTITSKKASSSSSSSCCNDNNNNNSKAVQNEDQNGCACAEEKTNNNIGCCSTSNNNAMNDKIGTINEEESYNSEEDDYDSDGDDDDDDSDDDGDEPEVMDLEDIGDAMESSSSNNNNNKKREVKEMVTVKQAAALKKEGYRIIGSHSAVKLCRWTKHQLRGRGGCYKHTFYGITSYQCMETTPSLACANKCVFCWRHHKNPVGREWRWKTDDPYEIVAGAVQTHISMIKEAKGIPGVKMDRWKEAHTVRHCALSLVGEPIMYPRINELLGELHNRDISTFLVTNGQHPDAIETLIPITQLYVSVDASTPETLEEIDRPLFKDAWQRLRRSLKSLKNKGQRTVARLTVVKGWNSDEIKGYAKLIALGHCSLVEVKGVTFCGKSDASNLNMSNSPWHHEVVGFTEKLKEELALLRDETVENKSDDADLIPEYDLATAHQHSCSVLLARVDQFATDDPVTGERKWRTWIDYEKFQELAAKHKADPSFKFGVEDYIADTPDWALFGAAEEGFDPTELRHRKKSKHPKYTKFDVTGVPTHDDEGKALSLEEVERLRNLMEEKKQEVGDGASVMTLKGGEKKIDDASLMFRGLVITK